MASDYGLGPADGMRLQNVLPSTAPCETETTGQATPPSGCGGASDGGTRYDEAAGFEDERTDLLSAQDAWQRLLEDLRGAGEPAACGGEEDNDSRGGGRKRRRGGDCCNDDDELPPYYDDGSDDEEAHGGVVEVQSPDRVLFSQGHRETCTTLWVVNSADWIDVEHVLRRLLKCESSECHDFYSIGYVFFRSCAVSHVSSPSDFLKDGVHYRFPGTEVVVTIKRAHVEGVLEVVCYLEYMP